MSKIMKSFFKVFVIIFIVSFAGGCFIYQIYLNKYFLEKAARVPNYTSGEVVEVNEHGRIFYVTEQDKLIYILLLPIGGGLLILATFTAKTWKIKN